MKLEVSHTILNIKDSDVIINFYSEIMGFKLSDKGPNWGAQDQKLFL